MKQLFLLLLGGALFAACNNEGSSGTKSTSVSAASDTSTKKMDYPYTIKHPDNWEIGSTQNTFNALSALKEWENKNIDASMKYFADSIHVQFDGLDKTVSNDSLRAMITPDSTMKNMRVTMQDWESTVSRDKSEEYVTLWYRQFREDNKGKTDSMDIINDIKMKNGKIIGLDEYVRKLHR